MSAFFFGGTGDIAFLGGNVYTKQKAHIINLNKKKIPYDLIFFPTPIFLNLVFFPKFPSLSPLDILPKNLNILRKIILLLISLFPRYVHPHRHSIPFPSSKHDILPNRVRLENLPEIRNFTHH